MRTMDGLAFLGILKSIMSASKSSSRAWSSYRVLLSETTSMVGKDFVTADFLTTLCELILERLPGMVSSCGIYLDTALLQEVTGKEDVCVVKGQNATRLRGILPKVYAALRRQVEFPRGGYTPVLHTVCDLRSLNITRQVVHPIIVQGGVSGVVWVGLNANQALLGDNELAVVDNLTQHIAAIAEAHSIVRAELTASHSERNFLLGLSHDLKSPGHTAMFALREIVSERLGALSEMQRSFLKIVESCLNDQLSTISDVLDLARSKQQLLKSRPTIISPSEIINELFETYRSDAERKGVAMERRNIAFSHVKFDAMHFRRVVANLLTNAIKYTASGCVTVELNVSERVVLLKVIDTGIGIPKGEECKLFAEYSRVSSGLSEKGVGLGLVVAKTLAEANSASLDYQPNPQGGSIFCLSMPLYEPLGESLYEENMVASRNDSGVACQTVSSQPCQSACSSVEPDVGACAPTVKQVLVVEDDEVLLRSYQRMFRRYTLEVMTATTIAEARNLLAGGAFDLLLTDFHLGDGNVVELLSYIDYARTKVVLMTGDAHSAAIERLISTSPIVVYDKGSSLSDLERMVECL